MGVNVVGFKNCVGGGTVTFCDFPQGVARTNEVYCKGWYGCGLFFFVKCNSADKFTFFGVYRFQIYDKIGSEVDASAVGYGIAQMLNVGFDFTYRMFGQAGYVKCMIE